jgi:polyisoprenoid-binding protein YceI
MKFYLCTVLLATASFANGQQFMTRSGQVHFFSETAMENIEAENAQMSGLLDVTNGGFAFQVQMRAFHFEKALMEEHFNENYVESEKFPKATFQGSIRDWQAGWKDGETHDVVATGSFDFHGVKQDRDIEGKLLWNGKAWEIETRFPVALEDHQIEVPAVVKDNIAPVIDVDVTATLEPR